MPDLAAQIACIRRELALRERVYPRHVAAGRLKQEAACRELAAMHAVLTTLYRLNDPEIVSVDIFRRIFALDV